MTAAASAGASATHSRDPVETTVCHCRMCQKAVGGPFITLVQLRPGQITWTRGTPASSARPHRDAAVLPRLRHPARLCRRRHRRVEITSGSLDDPASAVPTRATGTESMLHWIGGVTSLASRTTEQNYANRDKRPVGSFQHPDRDTPPDWSPRSTPD